MSYIFIFKFVSVIATTISVLCSFYFFRQHKRTKTIDDFNVAKSFLNDLDTLENEYVIARGYQAIIGDNKVHPDIVKYLLTIPKSFVVIDEYRLSKKFFRDISDFDSESFTLEYKRRYKNKYSLLLYYFYLSIIGLIAILYLVSSLSYFIFPENFKEYLNDIYGYEFIWIVWVLFFFSSCFFGREFYKEIKAYRSSKKLLKLQLDWRAGL
ncbi:hypothetical protein C0W44_20465 [Photobacterium leiognathi subsp. mandapamensis]|nr:hypothetical protein C0W44_20465 [Photobacterium leiognathi subsp. mandapamensis]